MNTLPSALSTQTKVERRPMLIVVTWIATLLMSRLPQIILKEFFATDVPYIWIWLSMAILLLALTFGSVPVTGEHTI